MMTYFSFGEYEATKARADERLNQELTRIRNLPKRSRIAVSNKYGLKHASQKNSGLIKNLEVNLHSIDREERRARQEMKKERRTFTECTIRSFPALLPSIIGGKNNLARMLDKRMEPNKTGLVMTSERPRKLRKRMTNAEVKKQTEIILNNKASVAAQQRQEMLRVLSKRSKEMTRQIIEKNEKRVQEDFSVHVPVYEYENAPGTYVPLVTRLNPRTKPRQYKSSFPPLLAQSLLERDQKCALNAESHSKQANYNQISKNRKIRLLTPNHTHRHELEDTNSSFHAGPSTEGDDESKLYSIVVQYPVNQDHAKLASKTHFARRNSLYTSFRSGK